MASLAITTWRAAVLGRWTARISGTLMALLFLALLIGEGPPNIFKLSNSDKLQFLGMIALFFGLVLAWKWEGLGGLASVAGFALLVVLSRSRFTWVICVPAAIGVMHMICWERLHVAAPAGLVSWRLPRPVIAALVAAPGLFVLLCVNEAFGNPPLMTPSLHPSPPLAGEWHATDLTIAIHPDASVSGTIEGSAVSSARIAYRRSWFGAFMHFNSEYMIVGELDGNMFTVGLWWRGERLFGSLYKEGRPRIVELRK